MFWFCLLLADPVPIDSLIDNVVAKRADLQRAQKAEAQAVADLKSAYADLTKKINDLGLNGPTPGPTPVVPVDPLTLKLWTAYRADPAPDKADTLKDLAELMKQAQTLAKDPSLTTVGALAGKVAGAASVLAKDKLVAVRTVLKAELANNFPSDGPMTPEVRLAAEVFFGKLQNALVEAGK